MGLVRESLFPNECGKGLHEEIPGTSTREVNLLSVKLRYFDWPVPVFIRFIEISRIYRNIYEVK